MEYLANPFNHSVNSYYNDGICYVLNYVSLNLFYYILWASGNKLLEEIQQEEEDILKDNDDITDVPDIIFENIFDDAAVDEKTKKDLISLLDINSLERN